MVKPWRTLQTEKLLETEILTVRAVRRQSQKSGVTGRFVTIDTPDWVNVIAVTDAGEILLIRQYRHGINDMALEIPGGVVDAGESPAETAQRELLEETGYAGAPPVQLGMTDVNPAIQTNKCYTFLIRHAKRIEESSLEKYEEIDVRSTPAQEIPELISRGEITHSLVVTAFYWYDSWQQRIRR